MRARGSHDTSATPAEARAGALVLLLLWAVALVLDPAGREAFRLPKAWAGALLALGSLLPLAWSGAWPRSQGLLRSRAALVVLPFLAAMALSALASRHPAHVLRSLPLVAIPAVALWAWADGLSASRLHRLLAATAWPALALALVGISQFHDWFQPFAFVEPLRRRLEVTSLAGNVGDFAAAMVLPALLLQARLARREGRRTAAPYLALGVLVYALAVSQTLAALAALALGSALFWALHLSRRQLARAAAVLAVAAALALVAIAPLRSRASEKLASIAAGEWNDLLTGRLDAWRAAFWMFRHEPLAGVGPGSFVAEFVPAKLALLERGAVFYWQQHQVVFDSAHQELLQVAAELGVLGLAAVFWAGGLMLGALRRVPAGVDRAFAAAALAALAALSLASFPFRVAVVGYPVLLFLAWLLRQAEAETPAPARRRATARAAAVGIVGLALLVTSWLAARENAANRMLKQVEARTYAALRVAASEAGREVFEENLLLLEQAARWAPGEVGVLVARGSQYLLLQRAEAAERAYRAALALEPRPEIYLNLARALRLGRRTAEASAQLEIALRLAPHLQQELVPAERP